MLDFKDKIYAEFYSYRGEIPKKLGGRIYKLPTSKTVVYRKKMFPIDVEHPTLRDGQKDVYYFDFDRGIQLETINPDTEKKANVETGTIEIIREVGEEIIIENPQITLDVYMMAIAILDFVCNQHIVIDLLRASDVKLSWSQIIIYMVVGLLGGVILGFIIGQFIKV